MRRILILEDDATLRKHLRRLLAARGYEVEVAGSVAAFRAATAAARFQVLLLDLSLPDGSGLAAWAETRDGQPGAVAVLMTAHGTREVQAEAERLGMSALLAKPLDVPALLAALAA